MEAYGTQKDVMPKLQMFWHLKNTTPSFTLEWKAEASDEIG